MLRMIRAEWLKQKRSVNNKLILMITLGAVLLAYLLMGPGYTFVGAFNWWYTLYLPFLFAYIAATIVKKDEKKNYHGLLGIVEDKKKLWYAKIVVGIFYLVEANGLLVVMLILASCLLNVELPILAVLAGSVVLCITFAWQIPLFMYLSQKLGTFVCLIISFSCNGLLACLLAVKNCWWIPSAIPARLMCPVTGILPNGLLVSQSGKQFADTGVILPGILLTLLLLAGVSYLTAQCFERREV